MEGYTITKITIPSTVKSIDDGAFHGQSITELVIPGNVKSISSSAFEYCDNLKSVKFEEGVETFEMENSDHLFSQCTNLEEISFPSTMKCIPDYGLGWSLKKVTISEGVTKIDDNAFDSCQIKSLKLPSTLKEIGKEAFAHCNELKSLKLEDGVETIGSDAFSWCFDLESINIPSSVKTISIGVGILPFFQDYGLKSITVASENKNYCSIDNVLFSKDKTLLYQYPTAKDDTNFTIPDGVVKIGEDSFFGSKLNSVTIPSSVKIIGAEAFGLCDKLSTVTLENGIEEIQACAFMRCSFKNIKLPKSLKYLNTNGGYSCFADNNSLTSIDVDSDNEYLCSVDGVLYSKDKSYLYQYPIGKTDTSYTLDSNVKTIEGSAFGYCKNIQNVIIPNGVTTIGNYVFRNCSNLKSITIPGSVKKIGYIDVNDTEYNYKDLLAPAYPNDSIFGVEITEGKNKGEYETNPLLTINCPKDSLAEEYANAYKVKCNFINDQKPAETSKTVTTRDNVYESIEGDKIDFKCGKFVLTAPASIFTNNNDNTASLDILTSTNITDSMSTAAKSAGVNALESFDLFMNAENGEIKYDSATPLIFKFTLTDDVIAKLNGKTPVMYYFDNGKFTALKTTFDAKTNTVTVELPHLSTYVLGTIDNTAAGTTTGTTTNGSTVTNNTSSSPATTSTTASKTSNPKTGDYNAINITLAFISLILCAFAGTAIYRKKRETNN